MKRGERKLWRELAEIADKVATSKDYAEEYINKRAFVRKDQEMERFARKVVAWPDKL